MTWSTLKQVFQFVIFSRALLSSVSRREIRDAGMTLIFDAKRANPQPQLYKAMMEFQVKYKSEFTVLFFPLIPSKEMAEQRWVVFTLCETVAGADFPGHKQRRAAGGQGEQPAAREVSRHLGQPVHSFYPLLCWTAMWFKRNRLNFGTDTKYKSVRSHGLLTE